MEKWIEAFPGMIPEGNYQAKVAYGEEAGLVLELKNAQNRIVLDFGIVKAIRILDEGIVQSDLYSEGAIEEFKKEGFRNVIYEAADGEFANQIQHIADGFWEDMAAKHYIIITQNYNIDIITEWEPEIVVS